MRLEEQETKYNLLYTPGDIESMRNALSRYTELILSGEAFEDDYCVAHFSHSCERLSITYFKEHPQMLKFIKDQSYYSENKAEEELEDLQSMMTGEALFFLCALIHPELESDIKASCEAMVDYARGINDSSSMWLTCEYPFGIEPLHITATVYPKYGYLLASFLVPYWDDEHMPEALFELAQWSGGLGITEDTIKAFCYCDNGRARENMLGYDTWDGASQEPVDSNFDLIGYFRQDAKAYERFINLLADRYEAMPYLQYDSDGDYYVENPAKPLVLEMLHVHHPCDTWDDDFDEDEYLLNKFVDTPADEAIDYIKERIEEKLQRPIVLSKEDFLAKKEREERIEEEIKSRFSETDKWKDLILKVFPNGENLWRYVEKGDNPEILETIEAFDIVAAAAKHRCLLAADLKNEVIYSDLTESIDRVMRDYVSERYDLDDDQESNLAKEEVLRLYDILHLVMGKPPLHSETVELFFDDYELATPDELYKRYQVEWEKEILSLSLEVDGRHLEKENEPRLMGRIYELISGHREEGVEVLSSWFKSDESVDQDDEDFLSDKKNVSAQGCGLIAMYILYRDHILGIEDSMTETARNFVEKFIPDFVMACMTEDGKWPKYSTFKWARENTFDNDYQKGRQKEVLEAYELWRPMEEYLKTGIFKDFNRDQSFDKALEYFKANLDLDEYEIADLQPQYEWLCSFNDENKAMFKMAFWASQIDDMDSKDMLERVLKLALNLGPIRVIKYLEGVLAGLSSPEEIDDFIRDLDILRPLGLPDQAYWIHQLNSLNISIDAEDIDLDHISEEEAYVQYYVRLTKLFFNQNKVMKVFFGLADRLSSKFKNIQKIIREGAKLIPRRELCEILKSSSMIIGRNSEYLDELDELALGKIRREVRNSLLPLHLYIINKSKNAGETIKEQRVAFFDMDTEKAIEVLESYGANLMSEAEMDRVKKQIDTTQGDAVIINKKDQGFEDVYHGNVIDYCYTKLKSDMKLEVSLFDLSVIENMSKENAQEFENLMSVDHKEVFMTRFEEFLNKEIPFSNVKNLLKFGVSDYFFLEGGGYFDVCLDDIILEVRPETRKKIVQIIGEIAPEKLDLVDEDELEEYVDFMFDQDVEGEIIFKFLISIEEEDLLEEFALRIDCSEFIKALNIEDQINALEILAKHLAYQPLVVSLAEHDSLKVRKCAKALIEKYQLKSKSRDAYHIVDYGIYKMGGPLKDSATEGSIKVVNDPVCIDNTDTIGAKKNMYFGLRFTADDSSKTAQVLRHKVIVTHPGRDETGESVILQTEWNQDGYSDSNIFLGWFFEKDEELVEGKYRFRAFDADNNLIVEKVFTVKL